MGEYKYIIESQFMKSTFCVTCQSTKYFCLIYMNVLYWKLNCLSFLKKKLTFYILYLKSGNYHLCMHLRCLFMWQASVNFQIKLRIKLEVYTIKVNPREKITGYFLLFQMVFIMNIGKSVLAFNRPFLLWKNSFTNLFW